MKGYWFYSFFLFFCHTGAFIAKPARLSTRLLLVSLDGFRHDYINVYKPPNFLKFGQRGVMAPDGILASFPTKTFPNHYTIVTGLYPESHGIVDNGMYDEKFDEKFSKGTTDTKWYDAGEPIWITGRLQGLKTGAYFWVGSTTVLKNTTATFFYGFDAKVPFNDRIDTVISWFANDKVDMAALYFQEPDGAGHKNGTFSEGVKKMVTIMDDTIGYLMNQLEKYDLLETTDVILMSDHGMKNISFNPQDNLILGQHIKNDDVKFSRVGAVGSILPKNKADVQSMYSKLKDAHPNVDVYLKDEVPARFNFRNNRRILPIVTIAKEGFVTAWSEAELKFSDIGEHGYDNQLDSMKPIFFAAGPNFKKDFQVKPFLNVNVYPLMCHLLGLNPSPNNGSIDNVHSMLNY